MQPPLKYQPYRGYGCAHPFLWYSLSNGYPGTPKRVRTRSGWRSPRDPASGHGLHCRAHHGLCPRCSVVHCSWCRCDTPWKRYDKSSAASRYEKRATHRLFRRAARMAIRRELRGDDDVSHAFTVSGEYLD